VRLVPGSVIAWLAGYTPKSFFTADSDATSVPKIRFETDALPQRQDTEEGLSSSSACSC